MKVTKECLKKYSNLIEYFITDFKWGYRPSDYTEHLIVTNLYCKRFRPGEVILKKGERSNCVFFIKQNGVTVINKKY